MEAGQVAHSIPFVERNVTASKSCSVSQMDAFGFIVLNYNPLFNCSFLTSETMAVVPNITIG